MFDDAEGTAATVCHRTLRRQVTAYIRFTNGMPCRRSSRRRRARTASTTWSPTTCGATTSSLPASQRTLMTLVLRKLLARPPSLSPARSTRSSHASRRSSARSEAAQDRSKTSSDEDYEALDETADEWDDDEPAADG